MLPFQAAAVLALPFLVLVRGSVYAQERFDLNAWFALLCGVAATAVVLASYALVVTRWLTGRLRFSRHVARIALVVTAAYASYALLYIGAAHTKSEAVRSQYRALHPMLRLALSTLVLADDRVLITDTRRTLDDYRRMGLPPNAASLHFPQATGYAHAADLRTRGRPEWRNLLMSWYFRIMGFETLRHVGTADHLHVSLPQRVGG